MGEGGSFLTPVTDVLLKADTAGLAPLNPSYTDANLDNAITDFVGNGPGSFDADFVVSERPLTSDEAATAKANGRTFAYVPFAATPVGVATLAPCNPSELITSTSTAALCPDIPLTVPLVGLLFTFNDTTGLSNGLTGWSDPRLTQQNGQPIPYGGGMYQASTLEPSAENTALMSLLDSDPASKALFDNALHNPVAGPTTSSDTPSETWPFQGTHAFIGGDAGLIEKELNINAETDSPSAANLWNIGDVFPLSSVWAGAPQGTPWNIPMAALQNAALQFVAPSAAAAAASEADATLDPTTNLVTFNANPNDAAAYNNYMMEESYLVVPTSGLSASKASKLAQYIRFVTRAGGRIGREDLGCGASDAGDGGRRPEGGDPARCRGCDFRRAVQRLGREYQWQFDDIHDVLGDDDDNDGADDIGGWSSKHDRRHREHRKWHRARLDGRAGPRSGARGGGRAGGAGRRRAHDDHAD